MKSVKDFELPPELRNVLTKAKKLEWITFFYLISVVVVMYLSLSSSQAMKSAWLEDVLSILPCIGFLIASHVNSKAPNKKFPYGYHRVFSIAFLTGALGLLGMGIFLVFDSSMALIHQEHPTIGSKMIFGHKIWFGWVMILALFYSAIPAMIIGFKKLPLAKKLHNKLLFTDARAQKADYMTALAAVIGILGVGFGYWWMDAVAALFISFSILKDGYVHVKQAVLDLMDTYPQRLEKRDEDEIILRVAEVAKSWPWASEAKVRFREAGQIYFGQIAVVPKQEVDLDEMDAAYRQVRDLHWKIHDFSISLVKELPSW